MWKGLMSEIVMVVGLWVENIILCGCGLSWAMVFGVMGLRCACVNIVGSVVSIGLRCVVISVVL